MKLTFKTGKGINRDQLPAELEPGVWSDCSNMRFRNGCDERVGGVAAVFTTPLVVPYWMQTYAVGSASAVVRYLAYAGLTKAYVDDGTTQTEITRHTQGLVISALNASGTTSCTLTTSGNHGLSVGNSISVWGSSVAAYNGNFTIATVPGATSFTYTIGTATSGSGVPAQYSHGTTNNFTATADTKWTGGALGGVLIANSPNDGLFYWAGDTAIRMRRLFNSDSLGAFLCDVARPYKNFIVMLGKRSASGVKLPYRISWSESCDPGAVPSTSGFDASATNDAGEVDKAETPGVCVDALQFGDAMYVYKKDAYIAMQYVGGIDKFSFRYVPQSEGLLSIGCVVDTPAGHVFMTPGFDVMVHQGGSPTSIANGNVWQWLRSNIDATYAERSFLSYNPLKNEVEVHIPTTGNTTCNKVLLWNCQDRTWGERDESLVTCGTFGMLPTAVATSERSLIGTTTPRIGLVDSGTTYFGGAFTSMVERTGIAVDDPDRVKILQGTKWDDDGTAGATSTVYHGSAMTPDGSATYATGVTHTLGTTNWANAIATGGRFMAIKRTTTAEIGKNRSVRLDFTPGGEF